MSWWFGFGIGLAVGFFIAFLLWLVQFAIQKEYEKREKLITENVIKYIEGGKVGRIKK